MRGGVSMIFFVENQQQQIDCANGVLVCIEIDCGTRDCACTRVIDITITQIVDKAHTHHSQAGLFCVRELRRCTLALHLRVISERHLLSDCRQTHTDDGLRYIFFLYRICEQ